MTKATGHHIDLTRFVEWTGERFAGQGISTEKCFATLTRDGIEIVAQRLVTAHHAHFVNRRRHFHHPNHEARDTCFCSRNRLARGIRVSQ